MVRHHWLVEYVVLVLNCLSRMELYLLCVLLLFVFQASLTAEVDGKRLSTIVSTTDLNVTTGKVRLFGASKSHLCPEMHVTRTTLNFSKVCVRGYFF
mgnify:CR=1 FL=1